MPIFETDCGKGAYIRALARDLGRALGCFGQVAALRRTRVGPFAESDMISLECLRSCAIRARGRKASFRVFARSRPRWTTSRRWP